MSPAHQYRTAADHHLPISINGVNLKDRLRDIQTNRRNRLHPRLLRIVRASSSHFRGAHAPVEEPSTASTTDITGALARCPRSWTSIHKGASRSRTDGRCGATHHLAGRRFPDEAGDRERLWDREPFLARPTSVRTLICGSISWSPGVTFLRRERIQRAPGPRRS